MCKNSYYRKGYRTFSDSVPGFAQGCYFPGDEPGIYCKLSKGKCYIEYSESPDDCEVQMPTDCICPECGGTMKKNGDDVIWCECGYQD